MHAPTFQPLYGQIKSLLVKSLEKGEWQPGQVIPSEIELAARYGVSQGTVRKAVDALAADNLLVRRQGKGTFVSTHTEEQASMFRFLRIRTDADDESSLVSRILDVRRGRPSTETARLLKIRSSEPVIIVRRILESGDKPIVLDDIVLPASLFRGLTRAKLDAYRGSMYGFFETQFGVRIVKARERLRAVAADAASAPLLAVAVGAPLLAVERVTLTYGDKPVEWRLGLSSTRHHHYANTLG